MFRTGLLLLGLLLVVVALPLAFFSQRYWFARVWRWAGRRRQPALRRGLRGVVLIVVALVAGLAVYDVAANLRGTVSRGSWWNAFLGLWLSSSIVAYLLVKAVSVTEWVWRRVRPARSSTGHAATTPGSASQVIDYSRRHFFHTAGFLAGAIPFVSATYGFVEGRFDFRVGEAVIPIPDLPAGLEGLRITQLSDIHIGSYMPVEQVRRAVGMANELGGDLAVVTGDFLTMRTDPLEDCIKELSRLRAPLGVWGCNGNHEIYAGVEATAQKLFERFGMRLLRQENAELRWRGSAFNLIGVDYQRQDRRDGVRLPMLRGVEGLVRRDVPNVLLSHNPNAFPHAAEMGIELILAGHTHGGQVRVEILDHSWNPAEYLTPYVAGLYQRPLNLPAHLSDTSAAPSRSARVSEPRAFSSIYVNRGLGTIGAPIRLGVPPEITLLTLRRA
jgi:predicted MPP superfamily phosphohydrolase